MDEQRTFNPWKRDRYSTGPPKLMKCAICERTVKYTNKALEDLTNCLDCDAELRLEVYTRLFRQKKMSMKKVIKSMSKDAEKIAKKIKAKVRKKRR